MTKSLNSYFQLGRSPIPDQSMNFEPGATCRHKFRRKKGYDTIGDANYHMHILFQGEYVLNNDSYTHLILWKLFCYIVDVVTIAQIVWDLLFVLNFQEFLKNAIEHEHYTICIRI